MITRTKIGLLVGLMVVSLASSAMADKLCLQTTVNKKTFKVTNKTVTAATCPKGYAELADTSSFQGPAGAAGATGAQGAQGVAGATGPAGAQGVQGIQGATGSSGVAGIGYSTCQKRHRITNTVINNTNKTIRVTLGPICEAGEFTIGQDMSAGTSTRVYSEDWSVSGDNAGAGSTDVISSNDLRLDVFDADGFPIGYNFTEGGYSEVLTGSLSTTIDSMITCCEIGD